MFLPNSFKPNSFLPVSFRFPESPVQDGRSGYWRLFYTKLQEEALKKNDEKAESKSSKPSQATVVAKPKRIKRRVAKVQRVELHAPEARSVPFVLRPVVEQPTSYDALANLGPLPTATVFSLEAYRNQVIIFPSRKRARRRAAAFLLMAA